MISKFNTVVLAGAAMLAASVSTGAQAAPFTAQADARAKVLKQISVTKSADLNFGTIVVGTTAGTVAIATGGARTCDAGLTCSGTATAAGFSISGTRSEAVTISSDSSVTLTSGTDTMTASLTRSSNGLTLGNTGSGAFNVGGALAVAANQAAGSYAGQFNVTVDYQ